jgi:DNA-binding PadR family transcriptional regulator
VNLDLILLGLLRDPASGYDLGRHIHHDLSHFWSADLPQLYRTLNRLARQSLLAATTEPSQRGPRRRVYRTTEAGLQHLRAALAGPPVIGPVRDPLLAQIHLLGALDDASGSLDALHRIRETLIAETDRLRGALRHPGHHERELAREEPEAIYEALGIEAALAQKTALLTVVVRGIRRLEEMGGRARVRAEDPQRTPMRGSAGDADGAE